MLRHSMIAVAAVTVALALAAQARAEEQEPALKDAPGRALVESQCAACHSLEYIRTNSPFMTQKVWEAEVHKMIKAFGAPIEPADAQTIIDYLVRNYGAPG
ncbi:MAG TPA: cytochrome c [Stellaceae bacterium]|nr:cytochrome c [Stellaceae bacterium]